MLNYILKSLVIHLLVFLFLFVFLFVFSILFLILVDFFKDIWNKSFPKNLRSLPRTLINYWKDRLGGYALLFEGLFTISFIHSVIAFIFGWN